jgi:TPP-dependent pyruvate/acetoin dehydrogenase alpha subunit
MTDTADEGMTREELALSLGEGISAHALVKALVSNLKEKGILTEADIEQIKSRATKQFAEDVQTINEADGGS